MSTRFSNFIAHPLRTLAAVVAVLGASGCGDSTTPPAQPARYLVSASSSSPIAGTDVTITAQVADANNNALLLAGRIVVWSTVGTDSALSATNTLTSADGTARVTLTTSTLAGITHTVTATGSGLTGTSPGITTVAGPAAKYNVSSSSTNPIAGAAIVITAQLADQYGNPVPAAGRVVTWSSTGSGGSFSSPTSTTDAGGAATVSFTASGASGTELTISATDGSAFTGTSAPITIAAGPAARYIVSPSSTDPPAGAAIVITAQLADVNGNPVAIAGRIVTWTNTGGGGAYSSPTSTTDASGAATVNFTTSNTPGATYTVTARDGNGLSGTSVGITTRPQISLVSLANGLGAIHSCGIASGGAAYCWGSNGEEQLGNGGTSDREFPVPVSGNLILASVSGGAYHTCGVTSSGAAYCWGHNGSGELGDNSFGDRSTPVLVAGGLSFSSVSAGQLHTCAVTASGAAYCWGRNSEGQLGIGVTEATRSTPAAVNGGLTFSSVTVAGAHSCGVTTSGAAYCWGFNGSGELGDNSFTNRSVPVVVGSLNFASVSAGAGHTCGVTASGVAYCWGRNLEGQLGIGVQGANQPTPLAVTGGLSFSSVAAGAAHSCGVAATGVAYCWGSNDYGELGNGTFNRSAAPVAVGGGLQFRSVSAGGIEFSDYYYYGYYGSYFVDHTCGITTAGVAYCWGSNDYGQLGYGRTIQSSNLPRKVGGQP